MKANIIISTLVIYVFLVGSAEALVIVEFNHRNGHQSDQTIELEDGEELHLRVYNTAPECFRIQPQ